MKNHVRTGRLGSLWSLGLIASAVIVLEIPPASANGCEGFAGEFECRVTNQDGEVLGRGRLRVEGASEPGGIAQYDFYPAGFPGEFSMSPMNVVADHRVHTSPNGEQWKASCYLDTDSQGKKYTYLEVLRHDSGRTERFDVMRMHQGLWIGRGGTLKAGRRPLVRYECRYRRR